MPIRPSSPSEFSNSLLQIDNSQKADHQQGFDNLLQMAKFLEQTHERETKLGTPSVPADVQTKEPWFAKMRGYQTVEAGEEPPPDEVANNPEAMDALLVQRPVYMKPGKPGTVGTEKLAKRIDLLPYIATPDKPKDQVTAEIHTLLTEPDDAKALSGVTFGAKKEVKHVVVTKDISTSLKKAGYEIPEGTVVTQDEYKNLLDAANLGFKSSRENRLSQTVNQDLLQKSLRTKLMQLKLKKGMTEDAINDAIEKAITEQKE